LASAQKDLLQVTAQDLGLIGRLGFRKWYEKQLIEAHLWLVAAIMCLLLIAVGIELVTNPDIAVSIVAKALLIAFGGVVGWVAVKRYARILFMAEALGETTACPLCARPSFLVVRHELPGLGKRVEHLSHDLNREGLLVRCKGCENQWRWGYLR
jgi:hypothetical protein